MKASCTISSMSSAPTIEPTARISLARYFKKVSATVDFLAIIIKVVCFELLTMASIMPVYF